MSKRRRTGPVARARRPIDKDLKITSVTVTTTVTSTTLKTTTFPCTVVGLRWTLSASSAVASVQDVWWAIVVVPDGESVNTPAISNAATFYAPEQNVLAFGMGQMQSNASGGDATVIPGWRGHKLL